MRKLLLAVALLSLPLAALADSWKGVSLVDNNCKDRVKAAPDAHTTSCALKCADSGFGVYTADGRWLKLDDAGNKAAVAALKKTKKADHLRADVDGTLKGDEIQVKSLSIAD
jgi:hypothetical protein